MTSRLIVLGIIFVFAASVAAGLNSSGGDASTEPRAGAPAATATAESDEAETAAEPAAPEATAEPEPEATATPVANRLNCIEIRGTQYHSVDERRWYLSNCL